MELYIYIQNLHSFFLIVTMKFYFYIYIYIQNLHSFFLILTMKLYIYIYIFEKGLKQEHCIVCTDLKIGPYLLARTENTSGPYLASKGRCPSNGMVGGPGTLLTPQ